MKQKSKIKVFVVGSDLAPPFISMEAKMVGRLKQLEQKNYDFNVLSIRIASDHSEKTKGYFQVKGVKHGPMLLRKVLYGGELLVRYLFRINRIQPQVIHFIWVGFDLITPLMIKIAKWRNARVIVTVLNRNSPAKRYAGADSLIFHSAVSKEIYSEKIKNSFHPPHVQVIMPPVEPGKRIRKQGNFFIFASGPKTPAQIEERGVGLLLDAMRRLQQTDPAIGLRFIGRWPGGAETIESMIMEKGVKHVEITHYFVPNVNEIISRSKGLVIPYRKGTIGDVPLSALEALASGTPVVSTLPFYISKKQESPAIHLCDDNEASLCQALSNVLENGDVSVDCQALVRHCTVDNFLEGYDQQYQRQ